MGIINILPKHISELIAAGEVVERPSSVVKELLENSIDAGAAAVTVEIKNGGITYIRVTDNGRGISRDDIPKVFVNHATSKLLTAEDLNAIGTLGFRGEALASIAAVSKVELLTRSQEEEDGSRCCISAGEEPEIDDAGCPKGTTLVVRDLFYNVPARMKFLKKDVSEANAVAAVVDRIALSNPDVSIRFIRDGKETLLTPGDGKLLSAVYSVLGKEFAQGMLPVNYQMHDIQVSGYICRPLMAKASRGMQYFFINGRYVKTRTAMAALEEAYRNTIMAGKFPSCVLHITVNPYSVDVNVHPAKIEVRFTNEKPVFDAVYYACKTALQEFDLREDRKEVSQTSSTFPNAKEVKKIQPAEQIRLHTVAPEPAAQPVQKRKPTEEVWFSSNVAPKVTAPDTLQESEGMSYHRERLDSRFSVTETVQPSYEKKLDIYVDDEDENKSENNHDNAVRIEDGQEVSAIKSNPAEPADILEVSDFKVIGEVFSTYILVELNNEMLIIDKHAAHERILFNKLAEKKNGEYAQVLLSPISVTLSKEEYSVILQNLDLLCQAGFSAEDFGDGTIRVREAPLSLDGSDVQALIEEIAENFLAGKQHVINEKLEWLYHSIACRAAVKAGDQMSAYEQAAFVKKLLSEPEIRYCPHGRPVLTIMTKKEFEKRFGRT